MKSIVYFRQAGERSAERSLSLIRKQWEDVVIQNGTSEPLFHLVKAMTSDLSRRKFDYAVAIDADMYILENCRQYLENTISCLFKENTWRSDLCRYCKFLGRGFGLHIYNPKYATTILNLLSPIKIDPTTRRPESHTFNKICCQLGLKFGTFKRSEIVCVHDYDQEYFHIFCKFYNRAARDVYSYQKIRKSLLLKREKTGDTDFDIAILGLDRGLEDVVDNTWKHANFGDLRMVEMWNESLKKSGMNLQPKTWWDDLPF